MRALLSAPVVAATAAGRSLPSWVVPLLLLVAAALVYTIHLDRPPHPDELYQIIPAEGLLASGQPRIADGLYTRAIAREAARVLAALRLVDTVTGVLGLALASLLAGA